MRMTHRVRTGHLLRHVPRQAELGAGVAALDIAQDLILAELHALGFFGGTLVFKGGTALRKLFAGPAGRFSTDFDFAVGAMDIEPRAAGELIAEAIADFRHASFQYTVSEARGRWVIHVATDLTDVEVPPLKLDIGPPCWLRPAVRAFEDVPVHRRYDFPLPELPVMCLEENLAEKIARLTRTSTARDASDLNWAAETSPHPQLDRSLIRRLAVLKVWVDNHGMDGHWKPAAGPQPFDPQVWLRQGREWDDERIGLLTHPAPRLEDLEDDLRRYSSWLADLEPDERRFASANASDRAAVVDAIAGLSLIHI